MVIMFSFCFTLKTGNVLRRGCSVDLDPVENTMKSKPIGVLPQTCRIPENILPL